jgi:hypothetical protein
LKKIDMKKSLRLIFILALSISYSQEVVHINFDDINPDAIFSSWNNSSTFAFQPNPIQDPVNASPNVGQFIAGDDNGIGIGLSNPSSVFPNPFDFTQSSLFKIKFLAGEPVTITLKIENQPDWGPHNSETSATYDATQIGTWQELTFDFTGYSDMFINSIVIKVDGPDWEEGDALYFDDIVGPPLYATPAFEFTPAEGSTDISVGGNMVIETNNKFYDPGAVTITDFSNKVALRLGDENGTDIGFEASIESDSKITITPELDLSYSTTYWFGIIENSMYHSNGTQNIGAGASFTTKAAVGGDLSVMMFDYESDETDTPFVTWGSAGFAAVPNPAPDAINNSSTVGQFTHPGGVWSSGIESEGTFDYIDFAETPFFSMKVWVDKPINIVFKLQNNPSYWQNNEIYYAVTESEINQWIQLTLNFSNVTASNYNRVQLWFDGDTSGGSEAGDVYYFDDIVKSNVPPAAEVTYNPADGATDVLQYAQLSINSNFQFVNLDGSDIDDASSKLELRENDSSGTPVPFAALISEDNNTFTIVPNELLTAGASYWYGVKDGVVKYDETQETISGLNATFTASNAGLPNMVVYNDFDGNDNLSLVTQALGDPAGPFSPQSMDPIGGSNSVMEWYKGESWGGWERIHLQLEMPFDISQGDVFSFRVFSSVKTGIRFKLADAMDDWEQTGNYESGSEIFPDQNILNTNQWKTYYFNVSEMPEDSNFDHLFIFLGRGDNEPGADEVFYIDDIMGPALQSTASLNDFDNGQVVLYPNPAQNVIHIKNLLGNKTIRIFDINGRLVHQTKTASNTLSIAALNQGFYFLEINGQTKKFIKK